MHRSYTYTLMNSSRLDSSSKWPFSTMRSASSTTRHWMSVTLARCSLPCGKITSLSVLEISCCMRAALIYLRTIVHRSCSIIMCTRSWYWYACTSMFHCFSDHFMLFNIKYFIWRYCERVYACMHACERASEGGWMVGWVGGWVGVQYVLEKFYQVIMYQFSNEIKIIHQNLIMIVLTSNKITTD